MFPSTCEMLLMTTCDYFYLSSYHNSFFFFFHRTFLNNVSQIVFNFILGLLNRSLWRNVCAASLRCLIIQSSSVSMILTSSHKSRWFPFSFHIWSAIPDFSPPPPHTTFWCSSSLTFSSNCNSWSCILLGSWLGKRCLRSVMLLLNIVLLSYGLHVFWIFSVRPLT